MHGLCDRSDDHMKPAGQLQSYIYIVSYEERTKGQKLSDSAYFFFKGAIWRASDHKHRAGEQHHGSHQARGCEGGRLEIEYEG